MSAFLNWRQTIFAALSRPTGAATLSRSSHIRSLQIFFVSLVGAVIIYFLFWPVFEGFTMSDMASRQMGLYPWAANVRGRVPPIHYDQADTFYPWQVFTGRAMKSGELPLWNPYSFAGHPFLANGQNGVLYPPRAYLSLVTTPSSAHDWLVLSHMLLGAILMFLLLSKNRVSFGASLFGAVAWMLNSFMLSWMALEHFVVIEAWLPLALLAAQRVARGSLKAAVGFAVLLALLFIGGNLLFVELCFLMLGSYVGWLMFRRWLRYRRLPKGVLGRRLLWDSSILAIVMILFIGLIAVQLLPTLDVLRTMERAPLNYTALVHWSFPVSELRAFFLGPAHELKPPLGHGEEPYHRMLYLGTPTAILALIGFWRRRRLVVFMRATAIIILLIATGTWATWIVFRFVPGFGHFKPLGRTLFLFNFAVAILAAFGLDWILKKIPMNWLGQRLFARHAFRFAISAILTVVVVLQLSSISAWVVRYQPDDPAGILYPETPLIRAIGNNAATRILPVHPSFYGSTAMVHDLQNAGGYDSLVPTRITRLWRVMQGVPVEKAIQQAPASAFVTQFDFETRFDLAARLSITDVVTPPLTPVLGCRGPLDESTSIDGSTTSGGRIVVGDWNGDGVDSFGVYDAAQSRFRLWNSLDLTNEPTILEVTPAEASWLPIAGDWGANGRDSVGLYDGVTSTFHLWYSSGGQISLQYGPAGAGWLPIAGDWNGDKTDTVGLYDPIKTEFHLQNALSNPSEKTESAFPFGLLFNRGVPLAGDWDGTGGDTIAIYYPGLGSFLLRWTNTGGDPDQVIKNGPIGQDLLPLAGYWKKEITRARLETTGLYNPGGNIYLCSPRFFGGADLTRTYSAADGDIYKVNGSFPRAYVVYQSEAVETSEDALKRFVADDFNAGQSVVLEASSLRSAGLEAKTNSSGDAGSIQAADIVSRSLNSLTLRANAASEAWLVVNESWDPGWKATVDGQPAAVLPANYAFRAVRIPAGEHIVEMSYEPASFTIGRNITSATIAGLIILPVTIHLNRRRRKVTAQ